MPRKRRSIEEEEEEEDEVQVEEDTENDEEEKPMVMEDTDDNDEANEKNDDPQVEDDEEEQEKVNEEELVEEKNEEEPVPTSPPSAKRQRREAPPQKVIRSLNQPGEAAQVGIIQQIRVENFMCHRKLRVDLCRNINFIHGQNGSGKSAILAALQICLGAGARRTHRARNLKGLVRQDHSHPPTHAKLAVTLRNEGEDAFRHADFGDRITVERTIALKSGGYNGYKLLDQNMKEVSRSRKDLDDMLDHL